MSLAPFKKHKIGDLIRDDTAYGDRNYGVVLKIGEQYSSLFEYDMCVKWIDKFVEPQYHFVDIKCNPLYKIVARPKKEKY